MDTSTPPSSSPPEKSRPSKKLKMPSSADPTSSPTEKTEHQHSSCDSSSSTSVSVTAKAKRKPPRRALPQTIDLKTPQSDKAAIKKRAQNVTKLVNLLAKKKKIVVIAGAGISVGAGIPDFRSSSGLFSKARAAEYGIKYSGKDLFDASVYRTDGSTSDFHDMIRNMHAMVDKAKTQPTTFHHLLASLASEGRLMRLYTQNVDGIETNMDPLRTQIPLSSKAPWPNTVQLHGTLEKMICSKCKWMADLKPGLFSGPIAPDCPECEELDGVRQVAGMRTLGVGKLRPRMVLYNEENPDADAIGAVTQADMKTRPDAVLVVGTSLKIPGVKRIVREMCGISQNMRGGLTVWINEDEPPTGKEFENIFDLIVKGDCEMVARLANLPRFDGSSLPETSEHSIDSILSALDASSPAASLPITASSRQPTPTKVTRKRKISDSEVSEQSVKKLRRIGSKMETSAASLQITPAKVTKKRKMDEPEIEQPAKKLRQTEPKKAKAVPTRESNVPKLQVASVDKLFRSAKSAPTGTCTPSKRSCRPAKPQSSEGKLDATSGMSRIASPPLSSHLSKQSSQISTHFDPPSTILNNNPRQTATATQNLIPALVVNSG